MKVSFHHNSFSKEQKARASKKVKAYTTKVGTRVQSTSYDFLEASLSCAGDKKYQNAIQKSLLPFADVKQVVLVGIGGSNLGTEAVFHALKTEKSPGLFVLDTIDGDALAHFEKILKKTKKPTDLALIVVSKSGGTTETIVNGAKAIEAGEKKFGAHFAKRVIFIGDANTPFMKAGKKNKVTCITMPDIVGGRYSVFSAVGIVPLTILGIDVASLRAGAVASLKSENVARIEEQAVILALSAEEGTHTVNFFTFNKHLEVCGLWYRQLLAESIGKTVTKKGASFAHHMLPIVSTGADLHSMSELYLGGYKNMYTRFVTYADASSYTVPPQHWMIEHAPFLAGKNIGDAKGAILKGVLQAYDDQSLSYSHVELEGSYAYEIGFFMSSLMYEMMCLADLLDIDPFHQPSVELYKKHTRALLSK